MTPTLVPFETLAERGIALSKCQLWRLERAGRFPQRIRISNSRVAWVEAEIDAWIEDRIAARRPNPRRSYAAQVSA